MRFAPRRTRGKSTRSRHSRVLCLAPGIGSCGHGLTHEAELRHLVELADVARQLEERHQPGALARPEAVAKLLEVPRQEARGIAVALARLVRERLGLGARKPHGRDERVLELGETLRKRL